MNPYEEQIKIEIELSIEEMTDLLRGDDGSEFYDKLRVIYERELARING